MYDFYRYASTCFHVEAVVDYIVDNRCINIFVITQITHIYHDQFNLNLFTYYTNLYQNMITYAYCKI